MREMRGMGLYKQWLAHRLISGLLGFDQYIHFTALLAMSTLLLGCEPDFRIAGRLRKPLYPKFVGHKVGDVERDLHKGNTAADAG
ncbi:ankyrin containing protein [Pseudozyma hubeiensis SY62]|uniref:Ankyrin containing protein n=1 Tax=Pseudozyma hubeiensis (strain SY62) TaxID=1305764 RepID=R9NY39_PSEHS|nr:ankyrin containing protein [Pseudozyma hubeiensis SY62]GAC93663.1 ankyrin containing protein [Pseudozyma hubeiensis SY62]